MSQLEESLDDMYPFVYIPSEQTSGVVTQLGAHGSVVKYSIGGIEFNVFMDNEDIIFLDELFEYKEQE
jgi:hypothetical protein